MNEEKQNAKKNPYPWCEEGYSSSGLQNGRSITVSRAFRYQGENADFAPYLKMPLEEVERLLQESEAQEQKFYEEMQKTIKGWDQYGAKSLLLQKVIDYRKVEPVKHTSNEWVQQKDGSWLISNLTYQMTFSITEKGQEWVARWDLSYTAPELSHGYHDYTRSPVNRIEHESGKKYKTLAAAQNYIQAQFDKYSGTCFSKLSPPVPRSAKHLFSINGCLLPDYRLENTDTAKEATVDELLAYLEEKPTKAEAKKSPQKKVTKER